MTTVKTSLARDAGQHLDDFTEHTQEELSFDNGKQTLEELSFDSGMFELGKLGFDIGKGGKDIYIHKQKKEEAKRRPRIKAHAKAESKASVGSMFAGSTEEKSWAQGS